MSQGEHKLADTKGRFALAVVDGRARSQLSWRTGRIVLSNRRLVVADGDGKRTVPLGSITGIGGRADVSQSVAAVAEYVSVRVDEDVLLLSPDDPEALENALYEAILSGITVSVKHPAVEGGVVQSIDWERGRLKLEADGVAIALTSGTLVDVTLDDVATVETERRTVENTTCAVVAVAHTEAGTSVETHIAGDVRRQRLLASYLRAGAARNEVSLELSEREREILMALYSGVSPFELPAFVGVDVDEVEEIFDRLIEADVLNEERVRREVSLTPRGRNLASDAMSGQ